MLPALVQSKEACCDDAHDNAQVLNGSKACVSFLFFEIENLGFGSLQTVCMSLVCWSNAMLGVVSCVDFDVNALSNVAVAIYDVVRANMLDSRMKLSSPRCPRMDT